MRTAASARASTPGLILSPRLAASRARLPGKACSRLLTERFSQDRQPELRRRGRFCANAEASEPEAKDLASIGAGVTQDRDVQLRADNAKLLRTMNGLVAVPVALAQFF